MSDEHLYEGQSHVIRLRVWVLGQMVWGAFIAGAVLLGIVAFLAVVWVVSQLLPEQSKQMPSPYSALEQVQILRLT
jgi:photosynthetic reaction center PufX protein